MLVLQRESGPKKALCALEARIPHSSHLLVLNGIGAAMVQKESAGTLAFALSIERILVSIRVQSPRVSRGHQDSSQETCCRRESENDRSPTLQAGQIVVMDNLQAHKSAQMRRAIKVKSWQVLFWPDSFPDLSPIAGAFSKPRTALKRAEARTRESLEEAVGQAVYTHDLFSRMPASRLQRGNVSWSFKLLAYGCMIDAPESKKRMRRDAQYARRRRESR
jgi:hypothetical protein